MPSDYEQTTILLELVGVFFPEGTSFVSYECIVQGQ